MGVNVTRTARRELWIVRGMPRCPFEGAAWLVACQAPRDCSRNQLRKERAAAKKPLHRKSHHKTNGK